MTKLNCNYFELNQCRSCSGLGSDVSDWRNGQLAKLKGLIPGDWELPFWSSSVFGSRTKAKFAVGGDESKPVLGRVGPEFIVQDLANCQLHHPAIISKLAQVKEWITDYQLTPYDIKERRGELKYIILQLGYDDKLMLRFVVRSKESLDRLRKLVANEKHDFAVVSVNIQPEPKAILEGEEEILLSQEGFLKTKIGHKVLFVPPKSFVQTNLEVAGALYETASQWLDSYQGRVLDLFCGVGGFASHLVAPNRQVFGVELSTEAIVAAKLSTPEVQFEAMDAWEYVRQVEAFDIIVVNPPRRGLGKNICTKLNELNPKVILYSSCNPETLKEDIARLDYKVVRLKAFEMFPMTDHWEVLTLLIRNQE